MATQRKVVKYRKPININFGVLLFFVIFVYIGVQIYMFLGSEQLSVYEVTENKISDDNTYHGLILRDEKVYRNEHAGYINYYVADGKKVGKGTTVYSLDESGDTYSLLSNTEQNIKLNTEDIAAIRKSIAAFRDVYEDNDYSAVYNYKYDIDGAVLEVSNVNMLNTLKELLEKSGSKNNFSVVKAPKSGIVSYYTDGYENIKVDDLKDSLFDTSKYKKQQLRSTESKDTDSAVYKLISSESWKIVTPVSDKQYETLKEKKNVHVTFLSNKLETSAGISFTEKDGKRYAVLSLSGYMAKFVNERFVNIELGVNSATGYKVPTTSVCEKEFYKVPNKYVTKGGNDNSYGIVKLSYSKNGEASTAFIDTDIYYKDDDYSYIDPAVINEGDVLLLPGSTTNDDNTYKIADTGTLKGVFNVNKGYPVFRRIEVLYENSEYCLVNMETSMGLNNFDHILVNVALAKKQKYVQY